MSFVGQLSSSKSLFNRALVVKSFFPNLEILGESKSDDVNLMRKAIKSFATGENINCGHAGTVLRFMAVRCSRTPGEYVLTGSERLFSRPKDDLEQLFRQLGVEAKFYKDSLKIKTQGWKIQGDAIHLPMKKTSQVATAFLLSSWGFPHKIFLSINLKREAPSLSYFKMTLNQLKDLGLGFTYQQEQKGSGGVKLEIVIDKLQKPNNWTYIVEQDLSSVFALACIALVGDAIKIRNFPTSSVQPDSVFLELLAEMGANLSLENSTLSVFPSLELKGIEVNLGESPDLFPSLSVLCALAKGPSRLFGAPHLKFKESDRIAKIKELLEKAGANCEGLDDGLVIHSKVSNYSSEFEFDCDQDHRLAMAAAILKKAGLPVKIKNRSVVNKSFPEFWDIVDA